MASSPRPIMCNDVGLYLGNKLVFSIKETSLRLIPFYIKERDLGATEEERELLCQAVNDYLNSYKVRL